jgi:hypothetical protein
MKTTFVNRLNFILLSAVILFAFASCKKDDPVEKPVDYVGVWVLEKTLAPEDGGFIFKDVINFSKNSFIEVAKIKDTDSNSWIDLVGRKGTLTISNGEMNISITEAGMTTIDPVSGDPTGNITYYKAGTTEFSALLTEMEMAKEYKALFTVSNNSMTLKADNNNNGSYDDLDEINTYTRQ